jgi:hypothetical protein
MKHSGIRLVVGVLILLVVVTALAGTVVWIKISALKNQLAENLGNALGAKVEVSSLALDLWKGEVHAAGIVLTNQRPDAPWDSGEISQATVRFHLRDLIAKTTPLSVDVGSWSVVLHPHNANEVPGEASGASTPMASLEAPSSHRVQVTQLTAHEGEAEIDLAPDRKVLIHGVAFDSGNNDGGSVWTTHLRATSIDAGSLALGASSVEIRGDSDKITFSTLRMECAQGAITGDGDVALGGLHETHVNLKAVDVPVSMLVSVEWQMKLSGLASGNVAYEGNDQGAQAQGQLSLAGGKFNILPFLGKMTSFLGMPDLSGIEVDKATADFAWKDRALHLTNIDIRKTDVTRITGQVDVSASNQVDGHLQLGLPSSILSRWPQLQATIFPAGTDDYGWADVHLTGTPDHLQEDLSSRVLAAGIQSGGSLLNQGAQKASDLLKSFMGP